MSLSQQFVSLARARTQQERLRVLNGAAYDKRFNSDQQIILRELVEEARKAPSPLAGSLRPLLNPADVCDLLVPCPKGPKPVLTGTQDDVVNEWLDGWKDENLLTERGARPPGPLLIAGPTGCGKSTLANYIAGALQDVRRAVIVEAHKLVNSTLGGTGANLDRAFQAASANSGLLLIEEIDALAEERAGGSAVAADRENNRISVAMMRLIEGCRCPIVATTNRASALDAALVRRFEYKLTFDPPSRQLRETILTARLGERPPPRLVELPLTESVPLTDRILRLKVLRNVTADVAAERVLGAAA